MNQELNEAFTNLTILYVELSKEAIKINKNFKEEDLLDPFKKLHELGGKIKEVVKILERYNHTFNP